MVGPPRTRQHTQGRLRQRAKRLISGWLLAPPALRARISVPTLESTARKSVAWTGGFLRIAGATHIGSVRRINQDAFGHFHQSERGETLFVVADGLGGHRGGEVASRIAVETLGKVIGEGDNDPAARLTRAIACANQNILAAAREDVSLDGMGTTIVCLLLVENGRSHAAHVGDSRLYRFRGGHMDGITEDHSLVAKLVREGILSQGQAREDPRRNQILRALGVRDELEIEVSPIQLLPGDTYLLCSDGLHGLIEDDEIHRLAATGREPEATVAALIAAANGAGGTDNITCLIASLPEPTIFPVLRAGAARLLVMTRSLLQKVRA